EDFHFFGQTLDDAEIVLLTEVSPNGRDHGVADLIERVHLGDGLVVTLGDFQGRVMKCLPGAVAARQSESCRFTNLPDAEREDKAFERNLAALLNRRKQI